MKKHIALLFILLLLIISSCARKGRPDGGPKDENAPLMISAKPPHLTTNFNKNEIKIYFDEYIKLKDLQKQLIVSPPLKYPPIIIPQGIPSKYITIKILDTLKENTTYTFNFGNSVIDNNEGNILRNFKYTFSTGTVIDSLKIAGTIKDAFSKDYDKNINVMLYEINDAYTDSILYKEKPLYLASTLDSTTWEITNIKAGNYLLVALKDKSNNYIYSPKEDKIGYFSKQISIPTDTSYSLSIFKEILPFKISRPSEIAKGHILFGYEGNKDSLQIRPYQVGNTFTSFSNFEKEKDTMNFWYKGNLKDSIQFKISNINYKDSILSVKLRKKTIDSLQVASNIRGTLHLRDTLKLTSNNPIQQLDTTRITFIDKDSTNIPHHFSISKDKRAITLDFSKTYTNKYKLEILPNAIIDFFGVTTDTLSYVFSTKKPADYGNLYLNLQNVKSYPILVELTNERGDVIDSIYTEKEQEYQFQNLIPAKYIVRIIYDTNKNKKWDTGNFLEKIQPEEVYYVRKIIDVRANWEIEETFLLSK